MIQPPSNAFRRQFINENFGALPYLSGEIDDGDVVPRFVIDMEKRGTKSLKKNVGKPTKSANSVKSKNPVK